MEKVVILFSGGLESTSLIEYFKEKNYQIKLLHIEVGYIWEKAELKNAQKTARHYNLELKSINCPFGVKQLGFVKDKKSNIIKLRNLTLLSIGANYALANGITNIAIGLFGDKNYPDTSLQYLKTIEKLIIVGSMENFKILTPFYGKTKKEIYATYKDKIPLDYVFSCANPQSGQRCGKCYKCQAFNQLL